MLREWSSGDDSGTDTPSAAQAERVAFPHLLRLTLLMDLEWMAPGTRVAVQRPRTCPDSNQFTVRLLLRC